MKKHLLLILALLAGTSTFAQVALSVNPYKQDFNTLAVTGTSASLPTGWLIAESGSSANSTYTAGTGSGNTGDTYSFGSTSSSERALGGLLSGSVTPVIGAGFVNSSGTAISSVTITYTGEFWRFGATGRADRIDFQVSTSATSLTTGTWTDVDNLDFSTPNFPAAIGSVDGNAAVNRRTITETISFASPLAPGASFFIRWNDFNAAGADDGLAVDDFSLSYSNTVLPSLSVSPSPLAFGNQLANSTSAAKTYSLNVSNATGPASVSTAAPFSISKDGSSYTSSFSYTPAELSSPQIIFVKFSPTAMGSVSGAVVNSTAGASSQSVTLTGTGTNPNPVVGADTYTAYTGESLTGDVSANDSDPSGLAVTYAVVAGPAAGSLTFNTNGSFTYIAAAGTASQQAFQYRATNTNGVSSDGLVTINLLERSKVFISQYYEGGSTNKWIELTNPTSIAVNTASTGLKLALYALSGDAGTINITSTPSQTVSLSVSIPAKGSVLIGNSGNGTEVSYAVANQQANNVINFNGNDGVALLDASNNIIDVFGQGINAKDASYVRVPSVSGPNNIFVLAEWERVAIATVQTAEDTDDPNRLGSHIRVPKPDCVAPAAQPTVLTFNSVGLKTISLAFSTSGASEYLIVRSTTSSLSASPVNGISYAPGAAFGGGTIAGSTVNGSFTDSNLPSGTAFYYFIYALNNTVCDGGPTYLAANPLAGSQATVPLPACAEPAAQPTAFKINYSNYNSVQGSFTAAAGTDGYIVVMSREGSLTASPADQRSYAVGDSIGGGIVISSGTSTIFTRSGLSQGTEYFFYIFSANTNCSGGPLYLNDSPLSGSRKTGVLDASTLNFYFGNLHAHSGDSDGNKDTPTKTPADDYEFAKKSLNMDFLGLSEHNHSGAGMQLSSWKPGIAAAKNATTSKFVALHGMEWGVISGGGHVIVYGIDSLIGWETGNYDIYVPKNTYTGTTGLFNVINRHGLNAFATLAHPNTSDYNGIVSNYDAKADEAIVGTAVESGPAFSTNVTYSDPSSMSFVGYYNRMLAKGYKLGATVDHDNHNFTFGRHTAARLVVLAPSLTENDLLDGIKKMRFYASEDSAARITFTINGQPIGSTLTAQGAPLVSVSGATTSPVASIYLLSGIPGNGVLPDTIASSFSGSIAFQDTILSNLSTGYYYAAITEKDGNRIITSPIWYTRDDAYKTDQTITFNPLPAKTYGDGDFTPVASSSAGLPVSLSSSNTSVATIVEGKIHITGAGQANITAGSSGSSKVNAAPSVTRQLTVSKAVLTVSAEPKGRTYGAENPVLSVSYAGFVNGDTADSLQVAPLASTTADSSSPVAQYPISVTGGSSADYTFVYEGSSISVTKAALTVTAEDKSKTYRTPNPVLTASYSGFVNKETEAVLDPAVSLSTTAETLSPAGQYPITASGASARNYEFTYVDGTLTIGKADQSITFEAVADKNEGDTAFGLVASSTSGLPVSFSSSNTSVASVSGNTVSINAPGTVTFTASQGGDVNYNAATVATQPFTVKALPIPTVAANGPLSFCPGGSVVLTSSAAAGYHWLLNGGFINQTAQSLIATATGSYSVEVTYSNGVKKTSSPVDVVVEDVTAPIVITQNISVSLVNGAATVSAQSLDNGSHDNCSALTFRLDKSLFDCSNIGYNNVMLTATDAAGNSSSAIALVTVVGTIPAPVITISKPDATFTGLPGNTIGLGYGAQSLTLSAPAGTSTYTWSGSTFLSAVNGNTVMFSPSSAGNYTITLTATSTSGCSSSTSTVIHVLDVRCGNKLDKVLLCKPTGSSKNPFVEICVDQNAVATHFNNGAKLGTCPQATGVVAEVSQSERVSVLPTLTSVLNVYPNPVGSRGTVMFMLPESHSAVVLEIYSINGKKLKTLYKGKAEAGKSYSFQLDGTEVTEELAIAKLSASGKVYTFKILKD